MIARTSRSRSLPSSARLRSIPTNVAGSILAAYHANARRQRNGRHPIRPLLILGRIAAGGPIEPFAEPEPIDWTELFGDPRELSLRRDRRTGDVLVRRGGRTVGVIRFLDGRHVDLRIRRPRLVHAAGPSPIDDNLQVWIVEETEPLSGQATLSPVLYPKTLAEAKAYADEFNEQELRDPLHAWAVLRRLGA